MKRASIRVQEPTPELIEKIRRARVAISQQKPRYRILREGKICCLKVGRAYRIPKAHLFTFLCIGCGEAITA